MGLRQFKIGHIVNTQGVRGEIRVFPTTDDPARFELLRGKQVDIVKNGAVEKRAIGRTVAGVRFSRQFVILKFDGVDDIGAAEGLKGMDIMIGEALALPLDEDEYYHQDLYDMSVYTEDGVFLGTVTDIIQTGANDVYAVTRDEGGKGIEILIPAIKKCVLDVDVPARRMLVRLLDGMVS